MQRGRAQFCGGPEREHPELCLSVKDSYALGVAAAIVLSEKACTRAGFPGTKSHDHGITQSRLRGCVS